MDELFKFKVVPNNFHHRCILHPNLSTRPGFLQDLGLSTRPCHTILQDLEKTLRFLQDPEKVLRFLQDPEKMLRFLQDPENLLREQIFLQ